MKEEQIKKILEESYLNLGDTEKLDIKNPLALAGDNPFSGNPVMEMCSHFRDPDYLHWACKVILNIDLLPFQSAIIRELWTRTFPMLVAARGGGKTFILSVYAILRALLCPGSKIVIVGAAFRQSKLLFEYMETFWRNAPILRSIVGSGKHQGPKRDVDRCTFYIGDSVVLAIPMGDGSKIRGLRANYIIADEFASIPQEIYETVVQGFASVSATPVEGVKERSREEALKSLGLWVPEENEKEEKVITNIGNQSILSGTAYYAFNHFADYFNRYKSIIESRGEQSKLEEIFGGEVPESFDWTKYSIIRIPYHKLPKGFMDQTQVARAKATIHSSIYQMEYGACFCTDSNGFFKRSLLESCVCKDPINLPSGPVHFHATTIGVPNCKYVFGIDPASEKDNFSIVVLEVHEDHRRIVHCWTTTRNKYKDRVNKNITEEMDFYGYCARKIRQLAKLFPTDHIGIDAQGGGIAIMEALQDPDKFDVGGLPFLPYRVQGNNDPFWWEKDKPTDRLAGNHILHMVQFAKSDWTSQANHGMRKDFEDKVLLFPHFDSWSIGESILRDKEDDRLYDTLEDCVMEIEELKDELATVEYSQSGVVGRDRWDTPEVKLPGNKRGRLRKDRYSALVIANMIARTMDKAPEPRPYTPTGSYAGKDTGDKSSSYGKLYSGPPHLTNKMRGVYGMGVRKR